MGLLVTVTRPNISEGSGVTARHASVSLQTANVRFEVWLLVFELREGVSEDELLQQHHYVGFDAVGA